MIDQKQTQSLELQKIDWVNPNSIEAIKKSFCVKLNNEETALFLGIGKSTNLNPFLREIWAVKYSEKQPASIFIGRDGYRKSAQANSEYDYHIVDAIYEKDVFSIEEGKVKHSYNLSDRGKVVGAYCVVKRKSSSMPMFQFVEFKEYYQGNKDANGKVIMKSYNGGKPYPAKETLWDTKPATMIKKVVEAQTLRMAFQELFAGTYDESENWIKEDSKPVNQIVNSPTPKKEEKTDEIKNLVNQIQKKPETIEIKFEEVKKPMTPKEEKEALAIFDSKKTDKELEDASLDDDMPF